MRTQMDSILIVESKEQMRNLLVDWLNTRYNCIGAGSAEEATELLDRHSFRAVVTEIILPNASGLDLCQLIQKVSPQTQVIVISKLSDEKWMLKAARMGVSDYIIKPCDISRLLNSIDQGRSTPVLHHLGSHNPL
jgi:DNA-binding NtrC family response regulator